MEPGRHPKGSVNQYLLAGLETGVLGALAMLAWLGICSTWYRRSFWTSPNLLASTFYGESALRNRFTVHTFAGLALYLLIYGALGILFGLAVQERRGLRITCIGILAAIWWYYVLFDWIWKHWNPLVVLYTAQRPVFAGHVLYGAILGCFPANLRAFGRSRGVEELRSR